MGKYDVERNLERRKKVLWDFVYERLMNNKLKKASGVGWREKYKKLLKKTKRKKVSSSLEKEDRSNNTEKTAATVVPSPSNFLLTLSCTIINY